MLGFDESENIQYYIIKQLLNSDVYAKTYMSHMNPSFFSVKLQKIVEGIVRYYKKTNRVPPVEILNDVMLPEVVGDDKLQLEIAREGLKSISAINVSANDVEKFMNAETQHFILNKKVMSAFAECVPLLESKNKHRDIVAIMGEAFKTTFSESPGLDYFSELKERLERASTTNEVFSTGLPSLDELIGGGYRKKALFVYAGPSNVGKTFVLNHSAATLAMQGYNVIYVSLELSEDYIAQRSDAKLTGISMNEINFDSKIAIQKLMAKMDVFKKEGKKLGKLIYKAFPAHSISCNDISAYLKTIESLHNIKADFVVIDYLKLVKPNGKIYGDNMYSKVGTVCEEMRALGVEHDACILTASQTGRQSYGSTSIGMNDISDSIGVAQTADVLITLARDSSLNEQNKILMSVSKSRFSRNEGSTIVSADYDHMDIIDISENSEFNKMKNDKKMVKKDPEPKKENKNNDGDGSIFQGTF